MNSTPAAARTHPPASSRPSLARTSLEFEKVLGRPLMYLIAAVARETVMKEKSEFGVAVFDECWWLTSSDEGLELFLELMRDGRKHYAAA
ncbi:ATP-binding protein [Streptomyces sp. NPDC002596]